MGYKTHTPKHIDEGLIKGKKVYLFLILPSLVLFLLAVAAWAAFTLYASKFIVNGNSEICTLVRRNYRSTIKNEQPCSVKEIDNYYLATFTLNPNDSGNAPTLMSFKIDKETKRIEPSISQN